MSQKVQNIVQTMHLTMSIAHPYLRPWDLETLRPDQTRPDQTLEPRSSGQHADLSSPFWYCLMRRLLCILLIVMHIVKINICMYFIFWKIILNHENVLLASPLHPADLDALFWKILKNVKHIPYLIFVYWGVNFFLLAQIFYERYQQIISTCGADVKYQVWQVPNVLFLCYLFKFCQLNKKYQIIADQWHQWWHSQIYYNEMIEEFASTKNYSTIHLFHNAICRKLGSFRSVWMDNTTLELRHIFKCNSKYICSFYYLKTRPPQLQVCWFWSWSKHKKAF